MYVMFSTPVHCQSHVTFYLFQVLSCSRNPALNPTSSSFTTLSRTAALQAKSMSFRKTRLWRCVIIIIIFMPAPSAFWRQFLYALWLQEMEKSSASHFMILLRDSNCQFRAVYSPDGQSDELHRVCGVGPRVIPSSAVGAIYKYSSDRKQFSVLPSRTLSMSVDAFTIPAHLWHAKKHGTPKKVATPK